jgi:hypothetical protein
VDPTVIVTLVVSVVTAIFASITAPLILAHRTERMHREDQLADYQRQDKVAQAAKTAADAAALAANKSQTQLESIAVQTKRIHTLVNSDMTAARQEELDQAESLIVALRRVIQLSADKGSQPEPSDVAQLERTSQRRDQLEQILADRMQQFKASELEAGRSDAGRKMLDDDADEKKDQPL